MNVKQSSSYLLLALLFCNCIYIGTLSLHNYIEPGAISISTTNNGDWLDITENPEEDPNSNPYSNYLPIEESLSDSYFESLSSVYNDSYGIDYDLGIKQGTILSSNIINNNLEMFPENINTFISNPDYGITNTFKNSDDTQQLSSIETSTIFGTDDRERVQDTTEFPYRTICKLYITAQDGTQFIGSGAIIDNFHVLTCGHCVYLHDYGGWASEIEIVPGKDLLYRPYGQAYNTTLRTYPGWISDEDLESDFALITLDRNLGNYTGWMGRKAANPSNSIYNYAYTSGYPGDLNNGERQYNTSNGDTSADALFHYYKLDIKGGQSGSPVWNYDGGDRYIISVVAYGSSPYNFGPRLTSLKNTTLNNWLQADASGAPADIPDLANRGEGYFDAYPIITSSSLGSLTIIWDVTNIGTNSSQNFTVDYYLTPDTTVNSNDYYLGSSNISGISPYEYKDVSWTGGVDASVPAGQYYIGFIIDSANQTAELDESNNYVVATSRVITVLPSFLFTFEFWLIVIGSVSLISVVIVVVWYRRKSRTPENERETGEEEEEYYYY